MLGLRAPLRGRAQSGSRCFGKGDVAFHQLHVPHAANQATSFNADDSKAREQQQDGQSHAATQQSPSAVQPPRHAVPRVSPAKPRPRSSLQVLAKPQQQQQQEAQQKLQQQPMQTRPAAAAGPPSNRPRPRRSVTSSTSSLHTALDTSNSSSKAVTSSSSTNAGSSIQQYTQACQAPVTSHQQQQQGEELNPIDGQPFLQPRVQPEGSSKLTTLATSPSTASAAPARSSASPAPRYSYASPAAARAAARSAQAAAARTDSALAPAAATAFAAPAAATAVVAPVAPAAADPSTGMKASQPGNGLGSSGTSSDNNNTSSSSDSFDSSLTGTSAGTDGTAREYSSSSTSSSGATRHRSTSASQNGSSAAWVGASNHSSSDSISSGQEDQEQTLRQPAVGNSNRLTDLAALDTANDESDSVLPVIDAPRPIISSSGHGSSSGGASSTSDDSNTAIGSSSSSSSSKLSKAREIMLAAMNSKRTLRDLVADEIEAGELDSVPPIIDIDITNPSTTTISSSSSNGAGSSSVVAAPTTDAADGLTNTISQANDSTIVGSSDSGGSAAETVTSQEFAVRLDNRSAGAGEHAGQGSEDTNGSTTAGESPASVSNGSGSSSSSTAAEQGPSSSGRSHLARRRSRSKSYIKAAATAAADVPPTQETADSSDAAAALVQRSSSSSSASTDSVAQHGNKPQQQDATATTDPSSEAPAGAATAAAAVPVSRRRIKATSITHSSNSSSRSSSSTTAIQQVLAGQRDLAAAQRRAATGGSSRGKSSGAAAAAGSSASRPGEVAYVNGSWVLTGFEEDKKALKQLVPPLQLRLTSAVEAEQQYEAALIKSLYAKNNLRRLQKDGLVLLGLQYMHYSNTARMAQSMLEGNNRRPALPTAEEDTPDESQQQQPSTPTHAAANTSSATSTVSAGGVVASSTGPRGRKSAVHSQEYNVVVVPGKEDSAASVEGVEAKQLAQRALERLRQEDSGESRIRNSWPGADLKSVKHSQDLVSVAHDISKLGEISSELAEQQVVVQQQLAASQALARSMREQAAAHNVSMEEVVGHFFNVYNIACFVATDRERVLDLLIDARAEQLNQASQLAQRSSQIQQLASDRDLALQKLWHSEEKLVALESQLSQLEQQVQDKQEELAAKAAALDVAKCATGPLAGLTTTQTQQLQSMLAEANQIVSQQRHTVQHALGRWKRSSGGDDSAVDCTAPSDSSNQLAWLQQEQRQLMQELSSLSLSSSSSQASLRESKASDTDQQQQLVLAASNSKGSLPQGFLPDATNAALQKMPAEVSAYVSALAQRMAAMQTLTEHISAEVVRKHEEAVALQASFMQVEVAKQLLEKQLQDQAAESAKLRQQLQHLEGSKRGITLSPKAHSDSPSRHSSVAQHTRAGSESLAADPAADGPVSVLDAELQPLKRGYVLGVAQQFEPDMKKAASLPFTTAGADSMDEAVAAATRAVRREATPSPAAPVAATSGVSRTATLAQGLPALVLPESGDGSIAVAAASSPATGTIADAAPDRQLAQKASTATPRSAGLSAFGRSPSIKDSPAASPRTSTLGKLDTGHPIDPIWVPAAIASSPRPSAAAVASPKSPASPILSPAAQAGLGVSRKDSGSAGVVAKKQITQPGFGSSSPTKRSAIPALSTGASGGGSSRMSASATFGGLSRIPGIAGAAGSSAVGAGSSSKIGSGASSPAMSPKPVAAVAATVAAAGDRSSPVFRSSRAVGSAAGKTAGSSSTGNSLPGSLSASTSSIGSMEVKGSRVGGSTVVASKAVSEAGKGAASGSSSPLKSRTIPSKK